MNDDVINNLDNFIITEDLVSKIISKIHRKKKL